VANESRIKAAGALMWKPSQRYGIRVALVHRPRYKDWSLPKGKARSVEAAPQTAAREVAEETGFRPAIGRVLTSVSYQVPAGPKTVQYFAARRLAGSFSASKEVDRLEWLPPDEAREKMTYDFDRAVLDTFQAHKSDLRTVVLVRHAKAGHRESFEGPDERRPLDHKGRKQALALRALLQPFVPSAVLSSPVTRCRQTVQPLAKALGLSVSPESLLGEEVYRDDPAAARRRVAELARLTDGTGCVVACSQGGVIPGVVKALAGRSDIALPDAGTPKGAFWVLSFDENSLVQADPYPAPSI
jgi:broad specificity phosphatase PhoE/8-oxo-dGTP pyrophosphatase MutT (NUDIX family)